MKKLLILLIIILGINVYAVNDSAEREARIDRHEHPAMHGRGTCGYETVEKDVDELTVDEVVKQNMRRKNRGRE